MKTWPVLFSLCLHAAILYLLGSISPVQNANEFEVVVSTDLDRQSFPTFDQLFIHQDTSSFITEPVQEQAPGQEPSALISSSKVPTEEIVIEIQNGFDSVDDGGTAPPNGNVSSGGGGGDEVLVAELGHMETEFKTESNITTQHLEEPDGIAIASFETGSTTIPVAGEIPPAASLRDAGIPGLLPSPGSGKGLGNGVGSGALGSQKSGSGSGFGDNGSGSGTGTGKAAPIGIMRPAIGIKIEGGAYPPAARRSGHEGTVILKVQVLEDGRVGEIQLRTSSGFDELDKAAAKAAKDWRFKAALEDGRAVSSWAIVPYKYVLH